METFATLAISCVFVHAAVFHRCCLELTRVRPDRKENDSVALNTDSFDKWYGMRAQTVRYASTHDVQHERWDCQGPKLRQEARRAVVEFGVCGAHGSASRGSSRMRSPSSAYITDNRRGSRAHAPPMIQTDTRSRSQFQAIQPVCSVQQTYHRQPRTTRATYT